MTFREFLAGRKPSFDVRGDFTRLALADSAMPDARSWIELRYYLEGRGTPQGQIEAGESLWGLFHGKSQHPWSP